MPNTKPRTRVAVSYKLPPATVETIAALRNGTTRRTATAVIIEAVERLAQAEGVTR